MANEKAKGVKDNPFHEHDCDACVFLGNYKSWMLEGDEWKKIDLYFCPSGNTFIARHGRDGDYWSSNLDNLKHYMSSSMTYKWAISNIYINEAVDRAIKFGLTEEFRI